MIIPLIKVLTKLLRTYTSYSATALPGLILEKYFPGSVRSLFRQLDYVIVITGTNGKTTTAKMLGHVLSKNNIKFVANHSGSNMIRGFISTLIDHADLTGKLNVRLAILETEEATLPRLTKFLQPNLVIVTNIFRDQLDAYGEIDKTLSYIREGIQKSNNPLLILNGDDQRVASLQSASRAKSSLVGLAPKIKEKIRWENRSDVENRSAIVVNNIKETSAGQQKFDLIAPSEKLTDIQVPLSGPYNCYNVALAFLAFSQFKKTPISDIDPKTLADLKPAFGRGEMIQIGKTWLQILLVKNPAGMNLNLELIKDAGSNSAIVLVLNDRIADGKDVSWIWDVDLGSLRKQFEFKKTKIYVSGTRCWDMALRLKYEGIENFEVFEDLSVAVKVILEHTHSRVFVLPTYTAMLELRKELGGHTKIKRIYE